MSSDTGKEKGHISLLEHREKVTSPLGMKLFLVLTLAVNPRSRCRIPNWVPGTFCLISLPPPTLLESLFQLPKLPREILTLHSEYGKEKCGAGKDGGIFSLLHSCAFYEPVSPGLPRFSDFPGLSLGFSSTSRFINTSVP